MKKNVLKENIEESKERMKAWWDFDIIDRPVIAYSYRKINFKKGAKFNKYNIARDIDNIESFCDEFLKNARNFYNGGEKFPNLMPNYGPGIVAAVFGVIPEFKSGTVWFHRPTDINEIVPLLESVKLNEKNEWYSRLMRITQYAVSHSKGMYGVALSDLGGVLDVLSSFLGPKNIIINMKRNPDIIDTCRSIILEKLLRIYDDLQRIIDSADLGCNSWLDVWCHKHWYPIQCDFSAMLSPKWFTRFALPDIVTQAEHMDYAIYHLDGPEQLKYVESLINEPSITGIQWVPGVGEASMESEKWFPLYKKIQAKRKNLVIDSSPMGAARLYRELDQRGLFVRCHMLSFLDTKMYLPKFMGGWGDFFGRKPGKLSEEYMIPKSKLSLKLMNKFET